MTTSQVNVAAVIKGHFTHIWLFLSSFLLYRKVSTLFEKGLVFFGSTGTFDCWMYWIFSHHLFNSKNIELTQKLFCLHNCFMQSLKRSWGSICGCVSFENTLIDCKKWVLSVFFRLILAAHFDVLFYIWN